MQISSDPEQLFSALTVSIYQSRDFYHGTNSLVVRPIGENAGGSRQKKPDR